MPDTTCLSPYLKFGCLSPRSFYKGLKGVCEGRSHTRPPVSLEGQLLWREFFYLASYGISNFNAMRGNPVCKQIPWKEDDGLLRAWCEARTGYPWIDAAMTQLRKHGWLHHLARHAVACFLTRGDLFVHWERGRDVFHHLLIDADYAINNGLLAGLLLVFDFPVKMSSIFSPRLIRIAGNWMWLSASCFFYHYYRFVRPG